MAFVWAPFLMALPALVVLAAWREGKRRGTPPAWLVTATGGDVDVTIDETTIAAALSALRIPQITTYLKAGTPLQFLTPARVDGRGTHAVIRLPIGVTAEKIAKRRHDLATGLHRLPRRSGRPPAARPESWTSGWPTRAPWPKAPGGTR